MKTTIIGLALIFGVIMWLQIADNRSASLSAIQDCVAHTALAEGYAGNIYSAHAWDLFAPNCN